MFNSFFSKAIAIALLLSTVNTASAITQVGSRDIESIATYASGILLKFTTSTANGENCTGNLAGSYAFLFTNTSGGKQMLATALAARVSDKPIALGLSGCLDWGSGNQLPKIYKVIL